jgi:hypothetical protein
MTVQDHTAPVAFSREDMQAQLDTILAHARHVRIDWDRLAEVAALAGPSIASDWQAAYRGQDEHYGEPIGVELSPEDLLQFAFIRDSQGWLIWERTPDGHPIPLTMRVEGQTYVGGWAPDACHMRALHEGQDVLDADTIAAFSMADVELHYRDEATGTVKAQLLEERLINFREAGQVLRDEFGGHFKNVLRRADGWLYRPDGQGLMQLLVTRFPNCFGDWPMAKLPNVLILNLLDRRALRSFGAEIDRLLDFHDLDRLVGGADYYRPWFFLRVGILEISDELKQTLRRCTQIVPGSAMELEYRAATIVVMRELGSRLGEWPTTLSAVATETHAQPFLRCRRCRVGITDEELPCPYRAVCKATHEDHELMACMWPLVLTSEY